MTRFHSLPAFYSHIRQTNFSDGGDAHSFFNFKISLEEYLIIQEKKKTVVYV